MARTFVSAKAAKFTESVIREMTRLANQHGAINLAQGFPDFPAPEELKKAASAAILNDINQYAITWGTKSLREALALKYRRFNCMEFDPETMVTVTCDILASRYLSSTARIVSIAVTSRRETSLLAPSSRSARASDASSSCASLARSAFMRCTSASAST